ncbi:MULTISPECIES: AMP-binding protein [unclassified Dietzia]|uniref:AMP-binding protein n=1 Tax=unclassified Dietzia TaxID=2617939 RepID=UPI0015FE6F7E|nr:MULTISPECIES: AMP-binding protein [unclassified Dietzia]MBB1024420.1 AMP-binding protein [Dietzia sp. DQ12-76]MBB1027342.1 AMP-binding protein [Dietzia sp. DQ11-38-2]
MADTVREQLRRHADSDSPAIRYEDLTVSWRVYVSAADRRAGALDAMLDDTRPRHVGTLLENTPEMLYALAAGALGGIVVAGINATRRGEGLARDIRRADCQILLTDSHLAPLLDGLDLGDVTVIDTDSDEWAATVAASEPPPDPPAVDAGDPFMLIFTSGTSGDPKAVRVGNFTVTMSGEALAPSFELTADDVLYLSMPLFHSNAIMGGFSPAIAVGATMALARRFSATRFGDDIRRYGVTYMNYVGKPLAYILDTPPRPDDAETTLRAAFGNEAAAKDIPAFAERFGCTVRDAYGSTELAIIVVRTENSPLESIGEPFPGVAVYDPVTGTECPRAVFDDTGAVANLDECVGELVNTEGAGFFAGYYNNEQATSERMRDGMYWSGDLAYRDADGNVYMAGRSGDWLRVDGENMAAGIVEEIVLRHPAVSRAAVYGLPDPRGVGDQLAAAVVVRHDGELDPAGLEEFLAAQPDLSPKAWPRWVRLSDALPTTATNKILKRELIQDGVGGTSGRDDTWWEREERGTSYSVLADARAGTAS